MRKEKKGPVTPAFEATRLSARISASTSARLPPYPWAPRIHHPPRLDSVGRATMMSCHVRGGRRKRERRGPGSKTEGLDSITGRSVSVGSRSHEVPHTDVLIASLNRTICPPRARGVLGAWHTLLCSESGAVVIFFAHAPGGWSQSFSGTPYIFIIGTVCKHEAKFREAEPTFLCTCKSFVFRRPALEHDEYVST